MTKSQKIEEIRSKISELRRELSDIYADDTLFKERIVPVEGLLTCGLITLYQTHKEVVEWEVRRDDHLHGPSFQFSVRGIGLDECPGCFVCGTKVRAEGANWYLNNISAFVKTKDEGDTIVTWFKAGAWLDYRPNYPNRIQLKIGSCDKHLPNLRYLEKKTVDNNGRIRKVDVTEAETYEETGKSESLG